MKYIKHPGQINTIMIAFKLYSNKLPKLQFLKFKIMLMTLLLSPFKLVKMETLS